jgi:polyisoprenoid-binding protein YceI
MKRLILLLTIGLIAFSAFSQRYITKNGYIKFYSETPIETIEAHNRQVSSALDISTGDFVFKVLMKSFEFEKALMQEHFNESYVESDKFPNAMFKGKILNIGNYDFTSNNTFDVQVEGDLTIHGVTQKVNTTGTFKVEDNKIMGTSVFIVKPKDHDIKIPTTVINNIAEEIEVTVDVKLEEFKK